MQVIIGQIESKSETSELVAKIVPVNEAGRLMVSLAIGWDGEERVVREIGWSGLSQLELEMLRDEPESASGLIVPRPDEDGAYDIARGIGLVRIPQRPYSDMRLGVQSFVELAPMALPIAVGAE